ncbi:MULTISPECIES: ArsC/Spx/MgsR family protein [unclassified Flavobacterium]|uniref:ArsC/Spx/MgsR family protein n=1 Tax=unclassified Flavobacterium TaxID=196869 RepID=UPI00131ED016|nr:MULTISPECIES: ArsC/Spx/MgsR family protein [unclassified Flavobacterium]
MIQIYHNPRCGKSRECLTQIKTTNKEFEIKLYLLHPLSIDELRTIVSKLNIKPINLVRIKEKLWIENYKNINLNDQEVLKIVAENPILMQRPLVVDGDKAIIGRDFETIENFLK